MGNFFQRKHDGLSLPAFIDPDCPDFPECIEPGEFTNRAPRDSKLREPLRNQSRKGVNDNIMNVEYGDTCKIPVQLQEMCTNITWYRTPFGANQDKQQIDLENTSKFQNGKVGMMASLTILNFTHSDMGIYMCDVHDGEEIRKHLEWLIHCGPSIEISKDVETGTDCFTIEISVMGEPLVIDWYFKPDKGTERKIDKLIEKNYEGCTIENPSLKIMDISFKDEGLYTCCAKYKENVIYKTASTKLLVKGIEITPKKGTALVGDRSFTFECSIRNIKKVSQSNWFKISSSKNDLKLLKGKQYQFNKTECNHDLIIKSISTTDAQKYFFQAKVDGDTVRKVYAELSVKGDIPTVSIDSNVFHVQTGTNFAIPCKVTAIPAAKKINWELTPPGKRSHIVDVNAENKYAGSSTITESLTIKGFDEEDIGKYQCFVTNAVGTGTSIFVTLIEKEPMRFVFFGPIGGGKSSIGNIFMQKEFFERRGNIIKESFTKDVKQKSEVVRCKCIEIADTPGVKNGSNGRELDKNVDYFRLATKCVSYGPNAFLLIVSFEIPFEDHFLRFLSKLTTEELKYVIVIFTTNRIRTEALVAPLDNISKSLRAYILEKRWKYFVIDIHYDPLDLHMENVNPTIDEIIRYCKVTRGQQDRFFITNYYNKVNDGFD